MTARTPACRPESPVCCISTETAIAPKISARIYAPQTSCYHAKFQLPIHAGRRMIGPYGDTGGSPNSNSQARQPQLGASHAACTCARHRVRTAGETPAAHARDVYLLGRAAPLVPAEQESDLIDPLINAPVDHSARGGLIYWLAESHRAKAEAGNLKIRSFQSYLIHCCFVSPTASPSRGSQNLAIAKSNYLAGCTCSVI